MRPRSLLRRWRRAASIFSYWTEGQFVIENYRTRTALTANPVTAKVLHVFSHWRSADEVCKELPEFGSRSILRGIRQLVREGFLLEEGSTGAREDEQFVRSWDSWLPHAAILHFGTKDAPYSNSDEAITRQLESYLKESPQPSFFNSSSRKLGSRTIALPKATSASSEFVRIILGRRTHREFSGTPLSLDQLSQLLYYTWGVTGFIASSLLGPLPVKTSPSAGARNPCEVYVVSLGVHGLSRGLYHYGADRHILEHISGKVSRVRASQYCAGQRWVKEAAALFLITGVFRRSMWKYRFSRAYRTVIADAAHLCQTFCLMATYLRLAPFCTMALKDSMIERDLGIDGINESVLYVAGVGLPAQRTSL